MLMVLLLLPFFLNVFYRYVQELHLSEEFGQGLFHKFGLTCFFYLLGSSGCHEVAKSALVVYYAVAGQLIECLYRGVGVHLEHHGIFPYAWNTGICV